MMHYVLYGLNGLLMIVIPLLVANTIYRHYLPSWGLFGIGAASFVGAQVIHIPFNTLVEQSGMLPNPRSATQSLFLFSLFYGLSSGLFEEGARYISMRFWAKGARAPSQALMLGAGHGGIESILLGFIFLINSSVLFGIDLGYFTSLVPPETLPAIEEQAALMLDVPLWATLLGALERLFALTVHIVMSLMVLKAVRGQFYWLLLAILWHTLLNSSALVVAISVGSYEAEIPIVTVAVISAFLIWRWVRIEDTIDNAVEDEEDEAESAINTLDIRRIDVLVTDERLDDSRFQ